MQSLLFSLTLPNSTIRDSIWLPVTPSSSYPLPPLPLERRRPQISLYVMDNNEIAAAAVLQGEAADLWDLRLIRNDLVNPEENLTNFVCTDNLISTCGCDVATGHG